MLISEFIEKAKTISRGNTVYMYGAVGEICTESFIKNKATQYPNWYTSSRVTKLRSESIGKQAFDCSGLIKYIMKPEGMPDLNADSIFKTYCTKVDKPFAGCLAHKNGHIGICISSDQVVEASSTEGKVICSNNQNRNWKEFGYFNLLKENEDNKLGSLLIELKEIIAKYGG